MPKLNPTASRKEMGRAAKAPERRRSRWRLSGDLCGQFVAALLFLGVADTGAGGGSGRALGGGASIDLEAGQVGLTGSAELAQSAGGMGCFSCNAAIELAAGERIGFRDTCEKCSADLHACLNCLHYDRNAYNQCRETNAEWVSDRERANRCDYFVYRDRSNDSASAEDDRARADLDNLFKKS